MMGFQDRLDLLSMILPRRHVPRLHAHRALIAASTWSDIRQSLKPFYSQMGQPSVDPETYSRQCVERLAGLAGLPVAAAYRSMTTSTQSESSSTRAPKTRPML